MGRKKKNVEEATQLLLQELRKAKKMPIGTVSKGRKKIAEGKWIPVEKEKSSHTFYPRKNSSDEKNFFEDENNYKKRVNLAGTIYETTFPKKKVKQEFVSLLKKNKENFGKYAWIKDHSFSNEEINNLSEKLKTKLSGMKDFVQEDVIANFWLKNKPELVIEQLSSIMDEHGTSITKKL